MSPIPDDGVRRVPCRWHPSWLCACTTRQRNFPGFWALISRSRLGIVMLRLPRPADSGRTGNRRRVFVVGFGVQSRLKNCDTIITVQVKKDGAKSVLSLVMIKEHMNFGRPRVSNSNYSLSIAPVLDVQKGSKASRRNEIEERLARRRRNFL